MHHFQLKPVRSLDNLRPAWSGHLRHSPSPSTVITNPCETLKKPILTSSPYPLPSDTSFNQSKMFTSNLLASKTNRTVKEVDKASLLPMSSTSYNQNTESSQFLHELNIHNNLIKPVDLCVHEKENPKTEENFSSNNRNFNCKDNFTNVNSIPNTWTSESSDRPFKTSNFLHEVNEDDPFDTSKVLMPIYLQTAPLFKSKIPSMPAPFHPLSHPFNTTSCSAHVKVNITSSIIFYIYRQVSINFCIIV